MLQVFELLNFLGFSVSPESSPLILFICSILVLSIVSLLCIINIIIYYIIIQVFENKDRLEWLSSKLPWYIMYIINIYRKTRISYIIVETFFLLFCNCSIIYFCSIFINGYGK